MNSVLAIGSVLLLTCFLVLVPITLGATYAQITLTGNNTSKNTSASVPPPNMTSPYQGNSIKIFVVGSFVREEQWKPINDYASHGWDIKSILPSSNRFVVVLEKESQGNQTKP